MCLLPLGASAQSIEEVAKLVASDASPNGFVGGAVALSGTTAVVGGGTSGTSESAYVFVRNANGDWVEQQKLTASDGVTGDRFGVSVAVSGDTIVVGADNVDDPDGGCTGPCSNTGAAYVFVRDAFGVWTEEQKLTASDSFSLDTFGGAVAASGDTIVVGSSRDGDNGTSSGSAYVFERTSGVWVEQQKITASDGAAGDFFGGAVTLEGTTAIIGAIGDDDNGSSSGSAYVFVESGGGLWVQHQKLTAGSAGTLLGSSVSLAGNTAIIGAPGYLSSGGAAFVFAKTGTSWAQQQILQASDGVALDRLGSSVSVSGTVALVGAPNKNGGGAAYVYLLSGSSWFQFDKLSASDAMASDLFGGAVAVSGYLGIVGARGDDDVLLGPNVGSVYVFEADSDEDGIVDSQDNCPNVANPLQEDSDADSTGNACEPDTDGDGLIDDLDNCPALANAGQSNFDGDLQGDVCDICPADELNDVDGDGWCGNVDNCPNDANSDQANADGDMAGNVCDPCPVDPANDSDGDGLCGDVDVCPGSDDTIDSDGDAVPDGCDVCLGGDDNIDADADTTPDFCDICPFDGLNDADGDGICGNDDSCPDGNNNDDADGDTVPDACDQCPLDADNDADGDLSCGDVDACPNDADNDADGDGVCGDVDLCPGGNDFLDSDGDTAPDFCDVCPFDAANDNDGDGICEVADNCDMHFNPSQHDTDGDGVGDACEPDTDNDGVIDDVDNCLYDANGDQTDSDGDGVGDACDAATDSDADGVSDELDACLGTPPDEPVLANGCSVDQMCPCDNPWKNHGAYVKCVAHTTSELVDDGVITEEEKDAIVSAAGSSTCGHKN
jgi:hypothetical protein